MQYMQIITINHEMKQHWMLHTNKPLCDSKWYLVCQRKTCQIVSSNQLTDRTLGKKVIQQGTKFPFSLSSIARKRIQISNQNRSSQHLTTRSNKFFFQEKKVPKVIIMLTTSEERLFFSKNEVSMLHVFVQWHKNILIALAIIAMINDILEKVAYENRIEYYM